ncbi:hypothetical protein GCM10027051_01440 [Niabella terrae]
MLCSQAQGADPEFRRGWLVTATLHNGLVTDFTGQQPDLYAGGLGMNTQFAVVEHLLRVGINAAAVYQGKSFSGLFGPMAALKIKNFKAGAFGTIGNMHLLLEANWGTRNEQLAGGGLGFEIFKLAHLGLTAQRDYRHDNWWLQSFIAIRLNRPQSVDADDIYSR